MEDEFLIRMDLADVLVEAGFSVLETGRGEDALGFVREGQEIALLITDIRLSGTMTGWELAHSIRAVHPELPVLYLSANNLRSDLAVTDGVFIPKPAAPTTVVIAAQGLLRSSRPAD